MIFSKSFGYALRGVLYVALLQDEGRNIHVEEIAEQLSVPKHFMGKTLKKLVKHGVLTSSKGPSGGFSINDTTITTPLIDILHITDGQDDFKHCVLKMQRCNNANPCPLHRQMEGIKNNLLQVLTQTTIADLLKSDKPHFIKSIATDLGSLRLLKGAVRPTLSK